MIEQVLVPLDTSPFAEEALPRAVVVARSARARLHVVCVRGALPLDQEGVEGRYLSGILERLEAELPGAITATVLGQQGPLQYPPPIADIVARPIAAYASARGVDLIVMATHGRGGLRSNALGSVADVLVRTASCPLLLTRPRGEPPSSAMSAPGFEHIVIAADGSRNEGHTARAALNLGSAYGARYSFVSVHSPVALPAGPPMTAVRAAAQKYLDELADGMRARGTVAEAHVIEAVVPGAAIVRFAAAQMADAIAISTRGPNPVEKALFGSTAAEVVRASRVPVLVCRPPVAAAVATARASATSRADTRS